MEFRILGPLVVHGDDRPAVRAWRRTRAVVARRVDPAERTRSCREIASSRICGERARRGPPAKALQGYVSQLRKTLHCRGSGGDVILTHAPGYVLRIDPQALDSFRFERLLGDGRRARVAGASEEAAATLREALGLWRGPPLAEFAIRGVRPAGDRPPRRAAPDMPRGADRGRARARFRHRACRELEALVHDHPLRERFRGQLMLALYRSGRQAEALQQYQHARRALVEELGLDPGEELQRLERAILNHDPASTRRSRPRRRRRPQATQRAPARSVPVAPGRHERRCVPADSVAVVDLEARRCPRPPPCRPETGRRRRRTRLRMGGERG